MSDEQPTTNPIAEETVEKTDDVDNEENKSDLESEKSETNVENMVHTATVKGKKKKKAAPFLRGGRGQAHIKATYNNTVISISDLNGSILMWSTAGKCGFKGPKKATPYAAGIIVKSLADKIKQLGIKELDIFVKGVGMGREAAVRAFDTNGLKITTIKDVTPVPHGGARPKKRRRV